jgi:hypothetical protein
MISPLSLSNVLTVLIAVTCLWTISNQSLGGVAKLWRLAVPPCLAIVDAMVLLAGVFDATMTHDAEWLVAMLVGFVIGRTRGWTMTVQVDRTWSLVRLPPALDGLAAAAGLVVFALIDFMSAALEEAIVAPDHVAAGAALCAGYLGGRALAVAVRARRAPHVELHDA